MAPADLSSYRNLIIDVDGVLRRAKQALPGAPEFLPWLGRHGIDYRIVTNNAMATQRQFCDAFSAMGIHTDERHIISSSTGAAWYLKQIAPQGGTVYIVGEDGIRHALLSEGLFTLNEEKADFVVVAIDRTFTYEKMSRACTLIRNGARFIATNTDATYPMETGLIPGAGSVVAGVQTCAGVKPTVIGKPERILMDMALAEMGARREETAALGDRLDTDIAGAVNAGMDSILVLTGVNSREEAATSPWQPALIFDDLPALMAAWEAALVHGSVKP
jgi:4-nitrophenyl phosphatase